MLHVAGLLSWLHPLAPKEYLILESQEGFSCGAGFPSLFGYEGITRIETVFCSKCLLHLPG